jgi:hypothetical protein
MIEQDLERARLAKALLDNSLLDEILTDLKDRYVQAWLSSKPADNEARERLYLASQAIDQVKNEINIAIQNGQLAKAAIERRKKRDSISASRE